MGKFLARLPRSVFLTRAKTGITKINTLFITTNLTVYYLPWANQFFLACESIRFFGSSCALGGCKRAEKTGCSRRLLRHAFLDN